MALPDTGALLRQQHRRGRNNVCFSALARNGTINEAALRSINRKPEAAAAANVIM